MQRLGGVVVTVDAKKAVKYKINEERNEDANILYRKCINVYLLWQHRSLFIAIYSTSMGVRTCELTRSLKKKCNKNVQPTVFQVG